MKGAVYRSDLNSPDVAFRYVTESDIWDFMGQKDRFLPAQPKHQWSCYHALTAQWLKSPSSKIAYTSKSKAWTSCGRSRVNWTFHCGIFVMSATTPKPPRCPAGGMATKKLPPKSLAYSPPAPSGCTGSAYFGMFTILKRQSSLTYTMIALMS